MTSIHLQDVTVDFPIYNASTRSLKNRLIRGSAGGRIDSDSANHTCVRALDRICFSLEHGDRVGLIGHNGAGKTTLLRVLADVYEPTGGHIVRHGRVASLSEISLGMDLELSGFENIMLRGLFLGLTPREVRARADEIADFTELGDYLAMPVRSYSSGMLLRLAFAVCTCVEPEILLMDEWIGVGDAHFLEKAQRRLRGFVDRAGILVLASHDADLMRRTCTKGLLLDAGRLDSFGPIDEVLARYESLTTSPVSSA